MTKPPKEMPTDEAPANKPAATFDDLMRRKKAATMTVELVMDSDAADDMRSASVDLEMAKLRRQDHEDAMTRAEVTRATKAYEDARTAAEPHLFKVKLQAIGRDAYRRLQEKYPPTDEQRKQAADLGLGQDLEVDTDAFPPAVIAASCIEPEMTLDQAQALWDDERWNFAELMDLYGAALAVNQQRPRPGSARGS